MSDPFLPDRNGSLMDCYQRPSITVPLGYHWM